MPTIYVAASKGLQDWAADVGLGKNVYKVGVTEASPEEAVSGLAGQTDWKILKAVDAGDADEAGVIERLSRKEKAVDPKYYPRLKGAEGLFKINPAAVENAMLVALALDNREPPKGFKVKPADIATHLIANALR